MRKLALIVLASSFLEARQVVDKIVARVNGVNILKSDLSRPRVNSKPFSLEEAIDQEIYFQEAFRFKMIPSLLEIEKQIASYRTNAGLKDSSDEEFEKHLKETQSFTIDTLKREYTRYIAVSNLLAHEIKNEVFVTAQEIENFYNENPILVEESYKLKTVIVPFENAQTSEEALKYKDKLEWIEHDDWLKKSSIADDMSEIFKLNKNEFSTPIKTKYGYQIVQLVDKKPQHKKSLEESYIEIEKKLREAKTAKFENSFKKELRAKALIVYMEQPAFNNSLRSTASSN